MKKTQSQQSIADEAAEWLVELREGTADEAVLAQFSRWLRRSPEHIQCYLELAAFWEDAPNLVRKESLDVDALVAWANEEDNVVPLHSPRGSPLEAGSESLTRASQSTPPPGSLVSIPRRALVAACAVLALTAVATGAWLYSQRGVYATDVGEQRSITLEDGSTVVLNARSRIHVHLGTSERAIELLEGQAMFHVAQDRLRPFTVRSGDTRVRAVGTQFDVYRQNKVTTVTVLEGRVIVLDESQHPAVPSAVLAQVDQPTPASAGEQVTISAGERSLHKAADVEAATAWTRRLIVFQGAPLLEVVHEFNRYNKRRMVIDDASLENVRVSGVFSSTDPSTLLRFLREQVQLAVNESEGTISITRK